MKTQIKIEDSLKKLESIVAQIESGETGLEESLEQFKAGLLLAQKIKSRLNTIEKEVETINQEFGDSA